MPERAEVPAPGVCAEHGGLMWSNTMRACITPDDVIRGGCRWRPFDPEAMGMVRHYDVSTGNMTWAEPDA